VATHTEPAGLNPMTEAQRSAPLPLCSAASRFWDHSRSMRILMYCFRYLTESLPLEKRRPLEPKRLLSDYRRVFASPTFQRAAGAIAFNFAGLFLYVAAAPVFLGTTWV
jgi:hypothetical protein